MRHVQEYKAFEKFLELSSVVTATAERTVLQCVAVCCGMTAEGGFGEMLMIGNGLDFCETHTHTYSDTLFSVCL